MFAETIKISEIYIETLDPDDPEVRELLAASDAFYVDLYPAESNHLDSADELNGAGVRFVGCRWDGRLVASGAAKLMRDDGDYAEIKRVFVLEDYRGCGLSRRIMQWLESELTQQGVTLLRLETGVKQAEALNLYASLGYRRRGPFGAYRSDPLSVFMEKTIE